MEQLFAVVNFPIIVSLIKRDDKPFIRTIEILNKGLSFTFHISIVLFLSYFICDKHALIY